MAAPDPIRLLGVIVLQDRPAGIVSVRVTFPAKWFSEVMAIVEVAD